MADFRLANAKADSVSSAENVTGAQRRRLERLDLLLAWDGSFSRKDLTEFFDISDQQASADMAKYREVAPNNSVYDTKLKAHIVTDVFESVFVRPSADRYLDQLQGLLEENILPGQTWFRNIPSCAIVPRFHPDVRNDTLRALLKAIRERRAVKVRYQPLNKAEGNVRWLAPHALAFSGRRWHARAFCFESNAFRDFVLTRIEGDFDFRDVSFEREDETISDLDEKWNNIIKVKLIPCRGLNEAQRRVIAKDYGMSVSGKIVEVREALFLYFADWHRLDPSRYGNIPEHERMIEAENWSEISTYMPKKVTRSDRGTTQTT